jgi:hypothetical protein
MAEHVDDDVELGVHVFGVGLGEDRALLRLAGAVLVETHDEWQVSDRRYLSEGSMALLTRSDDPDHEVAQPALLASWSNPQKTPRTRPSYTTGRDVTRGVGPVMAVLVWPGRQGSSANRFAGGHPSESLATGQGAAEPFGVAEAPMAVKW